MLKSANFVSFTLGSFSFRFLKTGGTPSAVVFLVINYPPVLGNLKEKLPYTKTPGTVEATPEIFSIKISAALSEDP